jgi:uncharacterized membrane protein (DUF485 family)
MGEFSDRLIVLLVAATGLLVFLLGWTGGLVEAAIGGVTENVLFAVLALLFLIVLSGIWYEFRASEDKNA